MLQIKWDYLAEVHCNISRLIIPKTPRKNKINSNLIDLLDRLESAGRFIRLYSTDTSLKEYRISFLPPEKKRWIDNLEYAPMLRLKLAERMRKTEQQAELAITNFDYSLSNAIERTHVSVFTPSNMSY